MTEFVFEGMTSISALIKAAETRTDARKIKKVLYDEKKRGSEYRRIAFLEIKSKELGFELAPADAEMIESLSNGKTHGGFIAICSDKEYLPLSDADIKENGLYFVLDGIEDPFNFGYTLRSLYASGVDGVIVPERNWFSSAGVVAKSSAGCSELIDVYKGDEIAAVNLLKARGYKVFAANIRESSLLYDADIASPSVFIIGGEKRGISGKLLETADQNIRIGYGREFSGSLPTATAAAILAFEAAKQSEKIK